MCADTDSSVPTAENVRGILANASVLDDLPPEIQARVADELSDAVVGALLHGATQEDLQVDLHSLLTSIYGAEVRKDDCADVSRQLLRLTASSTRRW